ncbi:MAG: 3-oxoacyl-ACP synthase [Pirellulaceae bacterium]|nr:MAG: 3-oxoacyl-ACP synthase [Pirellulaceae bacterium]GIW94103.1 MAG: 3-oxoacyl-ACP synthase [Pirellulaceae bacterium]
MNRASDIVVTGIGVVSPLGIGSDAFWVSLRDGCSAVVRLTEYADGALPVPIGAPIQDFDPKHYVVPRKSIKVMSREIQMGFAAARLAVTDARLAPDSIDPDRVGVTFGCDMLYCDLREMADAFGACLVDGQFSFERWGPCGMQRLYPLWLLMYLPNMAACHLAISFDARGPNNTITAGDASALLAIIEGIMYLQRGWVDVMVVGGTGTRLNPTQLAYRSDSPLSHRIDDPAGACRPFDRDRDGMVNGEGAGAFVLETRSHAEARGAPIRAVIRGWGQGFNANQHGWLHDGRGIESAIRAALQTANYRPDAVGHVNAHGAATRDDDRSEAAAIRRVLGDVPVTALKSYFGNLGAGSGAVEMAASLLAFQHRAVPPTRNYQTPDPECPVNVITDRFLTSPPATGSALVLSHSSTGQTAALLVENPVQD